MFKNILTYIAIALTGTSCKCSQTSSTPDYEEAVESVSKVITQSPKSSKVAKTLLTPEQMSSTIRDALGVENLWGDSQYDPIVDFFGVALGGVDFQSTFERDRSPKTQTLLVSRSLAMMVAMNVVGAEASRSDSEKLVFTIANMHVDTPDANSARWTEQVTDLYWRLLSREPTSEELSALSEAFLAVGTGSNVTQNSDGSVSEWTGWGWVTVLYGIMSTEEFWNI